jgi:hypothetical protein
MIGRPSSIGRVGRVGRVGIKSRKYKKYLQKTLGNTLTDDVFLLLEGMAVVADVEVALNAGSNLYKTSCA